MSSWIVYVGVALFVLALVVLAVLARRTDKQMDFEQSEGLDKPEDGLRLGIALGANANNGMM